jgi:FSR family fosmidomycin resistance protein-like MFS transporter
MNAPSARGSAMPSMTAGAAGSAGQGPVYGRLLGLSWAHFLNDGAANYLPGILPAILVTLGLPVSSGGVLMAALLVGQGMQPLIGIVCDRVGGRVFIIAGLAGDSLCAALTGFAPSYGTLILLLIVIGLSSSLFHPQALVAVRGLAGGKHGATMSIFLVGGEIGRGVWPVLASGVATVAGLRFLWILGVPALLTLLVMPTFVPPMPRGRRDAKPIRWRTHLKPLSVLVAFSSLRSLLVIAISTFVPIEWHAQGGSLTVGATFVATLMVVGIIGNLAGGRLSDSIGRRRIVVAGMALGVVAMVLFMFSGGLWSWVLIGLAGIFIFATFPLTILMGQDLVPENRSFGSGVALGFANALGALGMIVLGPIAEAGGSNAALWVAVAGGAAAVAIALWLPRDARRPLGI